MSSKSPIKIVRGNGEALLISNNFKGVTVNGKVKRLRYKEAMLLKVLVENYPNQVSRKELSYCIWGESYVTDATINQTIKNLRLALEDTSKEIINTVPRLGYCLGAKLVSTDNQCMEDEIYTLRLALGRIKKRAEFRGGGSVIGNRGKLLAIERLAEVALEDE